MWTELHGPKRRTAWGIAATAISTLLFVAALLLLLQVWIVANGESGSSVHGTWNAARVMTVVGIAFLAGGGWRASGGWLAAAIGTGVLPVIIVVGGSTGFF